MAEVNVEKCGVMRRMEEELDGERIEKLWKSKSTLVAYGSKTS